MAAKAAGSFDIDGSSTVSPISKLLVEDFSAVNKDIKITVGDAGTGAGFQKFIDGQISICDASRPIKKAEDEKLKAKGMAYIELPIAFDGLSIVVNPKNTWLKSITLADLKRIWDKGSKLKTWNEVNPAFPKTKLSLYGASSVHGSYEYFNEAVNGDAKNSRQDYAQCPDYNALVAGVSKDEGALGYVGFAYYEQNKSQLQLVSVDGGKGPVAPSSETIKDGTYAPLSRPLMMYLDVKALDKPEVKAYLDFTKVNIAKTVETSGYIPFPTEIYDLVFKRVADKKTGSILMGIKPGEKLDEVLKAEKN